MIISNKSNVHTISYNYQAKMWQEPTFGYFRDILDPESYGYDIDFNPV